MKKQEAATHSSHELAIKHQSLPMVVKPSRTVAQKKGTSSAAVSGNGRDELIRRTAYSLYVARRCEGGHELDDWLQAEAQINRMSTH
jgi:hypothetical protein